MSHKAQALVQTCIDFRFRKPLNEFLENELGLHRVDIKTDGGGVKKIVEEGPIRDWVFTNHQIAFDLHGVDRVILINHQDCGAYGGSKSFDGITHEIESHEGHLKNAASILTQKFPAKIIEAYFAMLMEDGSVKFKKVL
jgi:hypothetical protein